MLFRSQVQNQMIGQAQGLVGQGTAGGTSAANGLLGDVKSYLDRATTAGNATVNPYFGKDNPYTQAQIGDSVLSQMNLGGRALDPAASANLALGLDSASQARLAQRRLRPQQAAALAPQSAEVHGRYSSLLTIMGRITEAAREEGMKTLMDDGKRKALRGVTTISEVQRICGLGET